MKLSALLGCKAGSCVTRPLVELLSTSSEGEVDSEVGDDDEDEGRDEEDGG